MAFQDFDQISERRKLERQQKMKRRIMIAVVLLLIILIAVAAAVVYFVVFKNKSQDDASANKSNKNSANDPPSPKIDTATPPPSPPSPPKEEEVVAAPPPADDAASPPPKEDDAAAPSPDEGGADESSSPAPSPEAAAPSPQGDQGAICAGTDFSQACGDILSKASGSQPADVLKASMSAAIDEMATANDELNKINKDTPEKSTAHDDCVSLLTDAKRDLNASISILDGGSNINNDDLNNKLSAVLTYQDMCVDGFTEADKTTAQNALKKAEEHIINSLALVSQLSSTASPSPANNNAKRRLLTTRSGGVIPTWMNQADRRMLDEDEKTDLRASCNMTVAKDGSGNYTTINDALKAVPQSYEGRYVIYIKEGVYEENIVVTQANLTFVGDGSQKSVITASKNIVDDLSTYQSATAVIAGDGFFAFKVGFRNTAGPEKLQAVALRVQADHATFVNCRMEGYQAVIYAQSYRQFYRGCYITGTVDIILGNAAAVFQNCQIYLRRPLDEQNNVITAQGRLHKRQTTGTVLQTCGIFADDKLDPDKSKIKSYLGRPLKEYSRTIVMETEITDVINPEGWVASDGDYALSTLYFAEYSNKGAGSETNSRVKWAGYQGAIGKDAATNYTVETFIQGQTWLKNFDIQVKFSLSS